MWDVRWSISETTNAGIHRAMLTSNIAHHTSNISMHPYTDKSRGVRLQKALADAGVASRRDCEALISEGRISVNGTVVNTLPAWVDPFEDDLALDGETIARPRKGRKQHPTAGRHYVMLFKPRNVLSTVQDEPGKDRKTVVDLVTLPGHPRLYPVGRLDADSTGLILLTDDGEMTERLTHPRYQVPKQYHVTIKGKLDEASIARLKKGLILADRSKSRPAGKKAAMERVRVLKRVTDRTAGDRTTLSITLTEGQNREIRRLLARLGFKVHRLRRTAIGPLSLKGLQPGEWRILKRPEIIALRKSVGL
jgi:pseudouridine synthase